MATEVKMPKLGMTMVEGKIIKWEKSEGETVSGGETLYTVENDKVSMDIEAPGTGVLLKIAVAEGEVAPVGGVVAYIGQAGESITGESAGSAEAGTTGEKTQEEKLSSEKQIPACPSGGVTRATPAARALAKLLQIDLQLISGSGPEGRIKRADVETYNEGRTSLGGPQPAPEYVDLTPTTVRAAGADKMTATFTQVPHFYLCMQADVSRLQQLLQSTKTRQKEGGAKPTFTDALVWVTARVIKEHPMVNSQWVNGKIRQFGSVNFGIATDTPTGLMVPVIQGADQRSFFEITKERERLVNAARIGKLTMEDVSGGTFTLSNLGMFDIDSFQAILNAPESALLTVGAANKTLYLEDGVVKEKPVVKMSLSCDHRVLDGATGARFLKRLKEVIEEPLKLLDSGLF